MVATTGALVPQRSAFRLLLSHKQNEVEFVGAGSNRSHAAWTEFMPVRVAKALANEWVKIHFHTQ